MPMDETANNGNEHIQPSSRFTHSTQTASNADCDQSCRDKKTAKKKRRACKPETKEELDMTQEQTGSSKQNRSEKLGDNQYLSGMKRGPEDHEHEQFQRSNKRLSKEELDMTQEQAGSSKQIRSEVLDNNQYLSGMKRGPEDHEHEHFQRSKKGLRKGIFPASVCRKRGSQSIEDEHVHKEIKRRRKGKGPSVGRKRGSQSIEDEHLHTDIKRRRKGGEAETNYELCISTFYTNFNQIQRELCIEELETQNDQMLLFLSNETSRRLKIDKLLSVLEASDDFRRGFCTALALSGRNHHLYDVLKLPSSALNYSDSNQGLTTRFEQQRRNIEQNLEPKQILDKVVEFQGVKFSDNYKISKAETRQARVKILFDAITKLEIGNEWRILKPVFDHIPDDANNETTYTSVITVHVPVPETQPHGMIFYENIEQSLFNMRLEDKEIIKERTGQLRDIIEGFSQTSLNIHFFDCCHKDIRHIEEFCKNGSLESLLIAMLDEDAVNKLRNLEQVVAHATLFSGFKIHVCLCYMNKDTFKDHVTYLSENCSGFENRLIDSLIESKSLTSKMTNTIVGIKKSNPTKIVEILKQDDVPQICFCILQNVLLEYDRQDIMQHIFGAESRKGISIEMKVEITRDIVKRNAKLLEDEIEARCFIDSLAKHVGKPARRVIDTITSSKSRQTRNKAFIKFLCVEQEISWFQEELQLRYSYLADILTTQIKSNPTVIAEVRRVLIGLNDVIQDDLDPLMLENYLTKSLLHQMSFDKIKREPSRRKRALMFMDRMLHDENNSVIPEVLEAMRNDYNGLVMLVKDVVTNGSLSKYYRCPRINAQKCFLSTNIDLTKGLCKSKAETDTWYFRMVKLYSFMKDEISKADAVEIAKHLGNKNLVTEEDLRDISKSSRRRKAVEKLLKLVLCGSYDMYLEFQTALDMLKLSLVCEKFVSREREESREGVHVGGERLKIEESDYRTVMEELNDRYLIDQINDELLSKQIFTAEMHTDVVKCPFQKSRRLQKLMKYLETCSKNVWPTFLDILDDLEMNFVAKKLRRTQLTRDKKPKPKTLSERLQMSVVRKRQQEIQSTQGNSRNSSNLSDEAYDSGSDINSDQDPTSETDSLKDIGIKIESFEVGSIIIKARPSGSKSLRKLEEQCRSGNIKNIIPHLFVGKTVERVLEAGEYRLAFTIYYIPIEHSQQGYQEIIIYLENEKSHIESSSKGKSPMLDFLTEELDITEDLLNRLEKENIVDRKMKAELSNLGCRSERTAYVLKKVLSHGKKGYEVLKKCVKDTNPFIFKYLDANNDMATFVDTIPSQNNSKYSEKNIIFTCIVVLLVKEKGTEGRKKNKTYGFDYLTTVENPFYNFAIIEKNKGKPSRTKTTI